MSPSRRYETANRCPWASRTATRMSPLTTKPNGGPGRKRPLGSSLRMASARAAARSCVGRLASTLLVSAVSRSPSGKGSTPPKATLHSVSLSNPYTPETSAPTTLRLISQPGFRRCLTRRVGTDSRACTPQRRATVARRRPPIRVWHRAGVAPSWSRVGWDASAGRGRDSDPCNLPAANRRGSCQHRADVGLSMPGWCHGSEGPSSAVGGIQALDATPS